MASTDGRWIPADPAVRAGVYQHIDQVPDHHRLRNYAHRHEGRDCWREYIIATYETSNGEVAASQKPLFDRIEHRWKSFIENRGVHHALSTPDDANSYAEHLFAKYPVKVSTAAEYWSFVERFYRWMFVRVDYPHRYNPFVMAAANYDTSRDLWNHAINTKQDAQST